MAILTSSEIMKQKGIGNIEINPFSLDQLNINSYDVTLFPELKVYISDIIDPKDPETLRTRVIKIPEDGFILEAGQCYLARTNEYTYTHNFVPILQGKSSTGRIFLSVHQTAGYGDIGFRGYWTLNLLPHKTVRIYPNMKIGQIEYHTIEGEIGTRYHGKYQNSDQIEESKINQDFPTNPLFVTADKQKILDTMKRENDETIQVPWVTAENTKPKTKKVTKSKSKKKEKESLDSQP